MAVTEGIPGDIEGAAEGELRLARWAKPYVLVDPTIDVDGVVYTPDDVRTLVRERHQLVSELATTRDTLRLRSAALDRVAEEKDRLQRQLDGACRALTRPTYSR